MLASSVPRDAVDKAVTAAGRAAKRSDGKLPPHVTVYFAMAMALFAAFPPDQASRSLAAIMADITSPRNVNPARRHRS